MRRDLYESALLTTVSGDWSTHQLAEFLAAVTSYRDEPSAVRGAVERAAEAFEAEVGAVVCQGYVEASVGFGVQEIPADVLVSLEAGKHRDLTIPGIGYCHTVAVPIEDDDRSSVFILGRSGDDPFSRDEEALLRAMGRALTMARKMLRMLDVERALRERSEQQTTENSVLLASLMERQALLERLSRIQASISHRKPLQEVLDSITQGAVELLGSEVVGLRLIDPDEPAYLITLSSAGVSPEELNAIHRISVGEGAGGRAISEDRLIVIEHYDDDPQGLAVFRKAQLQTAMAAPVHENGSPIGSLVVASYQEGRRYSDEEKAALISFAEHCSIALTDAKTVEAMREAERSKDMFLAMVSHELKTPLTVIMGTLRTMERFGESLEPGERTAMLSAAYERGRDLQRLIDRLLQGASAELAEVETEVHLPDMVNEAVRGFEHSFRVKVQDVPGVALEINSAAAHRLIGILIENALSHSEPSSPILVGVGLSDSKVSFWVENQGTLPEGDVEDLFQPFHRGSEARSSGVGLGLYIATRIAASMGGKLDASSEDGAVRFTLTVPLHKSSYMPLPPN